MATQTLPCKIEACGKVVAVRGWCNAHYKRFLRHGDPRGGGAFRNGEPELFLSEVALPYRGTECLIWPYSKDTNGAGQLRKGGRLISVPRLICEDAHGPAPTPKHEAAHSCGNGHVSCVTRRHLSWKTHAGNMADMIDHGRSPRGERNGQSKLTKTDVHNIRALKGVLSQAVIADRFDVSGSLIGLINQRKSWAWLD